jgi:hypothetical protein
MATAAPAILGFAAGIAGTVSAFAAKYAFDFRLGKRRLELDERAGLATTLGGRPGQLRRASIRLTDRIEAFFRDAPSLRSWLRPASSTRQDGYFLRSSVQRVFMFLSWSTLMQQSLDSLPAETLRARRDLQYQYALLDVSISVLTSIAMFPAFPGYPTDRAEYNLFTGTVDELADLGVAAHNRNAQVIPSSEFIEAYDKPERMMYQLREWISFMRADDTRSAVVKTRFACLAAVLEEVVQPGRHASFSNNTVLHARLAGLESSAGGYQLVTVIPHWMETQLTEALDRWPARSDR